MDRMKYDPQQFFRPDGSVDVDRAMKAGRRARSAAMGAALGWVFPARASAERKRVSR